MRASAIARLAMVALFVAVVVAVAMSWQPPEDDPVAETIDAPLVEEGAVSRTDEAGYTHSVNGVLRYQVFAAEAVEFAGNRTVYRGGIELVLYSLPDAEGEVRATRVRAESMEVLESSVPNADDPVDTVRLLGDVVAVLPDGEELASDDLTYNDAELWTDKGARMRSGVIVIESRYLSYDTDLDTARMSLPHEASLRPDLRGPVKVWIDESADAPFVLAGSAGALGYDVAASEMRLRNGPEVSLPQADIRGGEILFRLDEDNGIRSIEAVDNARAIWRSDEADSDYVATGEVIAVDLGGGVAGSACARDSTETALAAPAGEPQGLCVSNVAEDAPRPRIDIGAQGNLRADVFEVRFDEGDSGAVVARGRAYFFPEDPQAGLDYIGAETLSLGAGGAEELHAQGAVDLRMKSDPDVEVGFSGPEARFSFAERDLSAASWPRGLEYVDGARDLRVSAGSGVLEPDTRDWVLTPGNDDSGRPRLVSSEFDVDAGEIRLLASGDSQLTDSVEARLRGDMVSTLGPVFGGAAEIEAAAESLDVNAAGDRLRFEGAARIFQAAGDQVLAADEIFLTPQSNELQARGNVFVSLVDPADPAAGRDEARTILLTGRQLLVEGEPVRLTVAGDALLDIEGQGRTIRGNQRLTVELDADGAWERLEVFGNVVITDPAGRGEGASLDYEASTGVVTIHAGANAPSVFVPNSGIEIRDSQGLRLEWVDDDVEVTAMQNGTTTLVRGGGGGGGGGGR